MVQMSELRALQNLAPYMNTGEQATLRMADLLGFGQEARNPMPTRQDIADEFLQRHIQRFGKGYTGDSNMAFENQAIDEEYARRLADWQTKQDAAAAGPKPTIDSIFQTDPGYQFRLGEGNKAIDRAAASRGSYDSGATLKALTRYGQDYASNEFGNVFARNLAAAGQGQNAAAAGSGINMQGGTSMANLMAGMGNAQGAATIAQGNAWGNALNTAGQSINNAMTFQQLMEQLNKKQAPTTYSWWSPGSGNPDGS